MFALLATLLLQSDDRLVINGVDGPDKGKHVVLLAGDEEYRSEEGLPQLAKILAKRHGFTCTVLFSIDKQGFIDPKTQDNQPGLDAIAKADACIMLLRFRQWPDEQMRHFDAYVKAGKPIIALRTSTHAFAFPPDSKSAYRRYGWQSNEWSGGFGEQVLGENWISHWGDHGREATRAVSVARHAILNGVGEIFGDSDVYEAHPPSDAEILMRGLVLSGMGRLDPPASRRKATEKGKEQPVNDPAMPVVWLRSPKTMVCTMGAATDLLDESLRRLIVNAVYWYVGLKVPDRADVSLVGDYNPSKFGFDAFKKGVRPTDLR
ncbi:MAG: hypothetical protein HONBIEJF_01884 [Fimbriimonadaceae bacterium]|nr:hypothetical protein [Fimbriimonadaceae bacterium]